MYPAHTPPAAQSYLCKSYNNAIGCCRGAVSMQLVNPGQVAAYMIRPSLRLILVIHMGMGCRIYASTQNIGYLKKRFLIQFEMLTIIIVILKNTF